MKTSFFLYPSSRTERFPFSGTVSSVMQKKIRPVFLATLLGTASLTALSLPSMAQGTNYHGTTPLSSGASATQREMRKGKSGKGMNGFGRLFSLKRAGDPSGGLSPQSSPVYDLRKLGNSMTEPPSWRKAAGRSGILPSGYVFLGQFIDHDITLDTMSRLDKPLRDGVLQNQRTVALDLDNVYGGGPERSSWLYNLPWLRVGKQIRGTRSALPRHDLLRSSTGTGTGPYGGGGTALIGDFRNDENFVISQLQMAFISFHNRIVNQLVEEEYGSRRAEFCGQVSACRSVEALVSSAKFPGKASKEIFDKARDHVIHYYHRVISEDFLPRIIGAKRASDILRNGRDFYFPEGFLRKNGKIEQPFIPIEFSGAAYRYGHAQVKQDYRNRAGQDGEIPLFRAGQGHGRHGRIAGFNKISADRIIDWGYYFPMSRKSPAGFNWANKLAPFLPTHLQHLGRVGVTGNDVVSLAARNLNRGRIFRLPSGQDIASIILPKLQKRGILSNWKIAGSSGRKPAPADWRALLQQPDSQTTNILGQVKTPLWYYILQEAAAFDVVGNSTSRNNRNSLQAKDKGIKDGNTLTAFGLPDRFYEMGTTATPVHNRKKRPGKRPMNDINDIIGGGSSPRYRAATSRKHAASGKNNIDLTHVGGHTLGPVGGTIVGEVLSGLLEHYREKTGKGLDYIPALKPVATASSNLNMSPASARNLYRKPLTATKALGIRYQMRNLIYDAGVGFPVRLSQ